MLFTGDALSAGGTGKTRDGYARGLLLETIRRKLLPLGDETLLFPGHGPPSKIGIEKLYNPFLGEKL
jgi:glyoxylase-like metal-dependent hydrolase (beta-lactamase superfamily II)